MENLFGVGSMLAFLLSVFFWFLPSYNEKDAVLDRQRAMYSILVAIFCRIAIVTYQMITIAELLQ